MKLLFITRSPGKKPIQSLSDASNYAVQYIKKIGVDVSSVSISDYSYIEDVMDIYKPSHVIIESIFIPPVSFLKYMNLYRNVKWYIRIHSDVGFFFTETFGMPWIKDYQSINENNNIFIAVNNQRFTETLNDILMFPVVYLPNLYKEDFNFVEKNQNNDYIDIGCFGALRQMKNQGYQAMSSIRFAKKINKKCRFHINLAKSELKKNSVISNLRATFKNTEHELVEHGWLNHNDFVKLIQQMDFGTQLSFSESFNFITCDFLSNGVPIAVSDTISWANDELMTSTFEMDKTIECYSYIYKQRNNKNYAENNHKYLSSYIKSAKKIWFNFLKK